MYVAKAFCTSASKEQSLERGFEQQTSLNITFSVQYYREDQQLRETKKAQDYKSCDG